MVLHFVPRSDVFSSLALVGNLCCFLVGSFSFIFLRIVYGFCEEMTCGPACVFF